MGIKGLLPLLKSWGGCTNVSIKEMADGYRRANECCPVLVVDGSNFISWLYAYREEFLECIYGGQWIQFKDLLEGFVNRFKKEEIKLIFIFDGTIPKEKLAEWATRRMGNYKTVTKIFNDISQNPQNDVISTKWIAPALKLLAKFALKELGVEVYQTDTDVDADNYIAHYAQNRKDVFAILSNDSDFVIFDTKPLLLTYELKLDNLETDRCSRDCMVEKLKLSPKQLHLFGCLMGNDYIPREELQKFYQRLVKGENFPNNESFTNTKAIKLGKLVIQNKWHGNHTDDDEMSRISKVVFGNKSSSTKLLIKNGLKLYDTGGEASPLTPWEIMNPEFEKEVRKRHYQSSNSLIYNLLFKMEYGSAEALEDGSRPPSALVYREIRQRCYGILFNCSEQPRNLSSTVIEERCWYIKNGIKKNLNEPEEVPPLPLDPSSDVITIDKLWFKSTDEIRFKYFWHILQIPMKFELLMQVTEDKVTEDKITEDKITEDQVALTCILNYLIRGLESVSLLKHFDVAVFVAQSLWELKSDEIRRLQNPIVEASVVNLSSLFTNGFEPILMALETCGFKRPYKYVKPWRFFDGKLFHFLYQQEQAKRRPSVKDLCNGEDEKIQKFYRLLSVATNGTEYYPDPVHNPSSVIWKNIFEDFQFKDSVKP